MTEKPVIVVTGASSGLGEASARHFAARGYRAVLAARRVERLKDLAAEIETGGGEALSVETDVGKWDSIQSLARTTLNAYGRIDVLFNNAGLGRLIWLDDMDPQKDIATQINVNLLGLIQTTRAFLPHMIEQRAGHVINMASMAAFVATPSYSVYAATKFGVRGFSDALRREVGVFGIKVSVIYPMGVKTEFSGHAGAKRKTGFTTPALLQLSPDDIARAVYATAQRPRRNVVVPASGYLGIWLTYLFPGLTDWLMERFFTRPERLG